MCWPNNHETLPSTMLLDFVAVVGLILIVGLVALRVRRLEDLGAVVADIQAELLG